jgi:hypothetical protein
MPNFRVLWKILKRLPVKVIVDHRAKTFDGPHGFDARERGRRAVTMRPLEPRDFNRSIKEEWIRAVNDKAEETINRIMLGKRGSRGEAEQWLKTGKRSVEKKFQQGNIHFVLRYDFSNEKFYWSSTRRVSDSDARKIRGSET